MNTLKLLLVTVVAAACVLARPPGQYEKPPLMNVITRRVRVPVEFQEFLLSNGLLRGDLTYEITTTVPTTRPSYMNNVWLYKVNRINEPQEGDDQPILYNNRKPIWIARKQEGDAPKDSIRSPIDKGMSDETPYIGEIDSQSKLIEEKFITVKDEDQKKGDGNKQESNSQVTSFALTPLDAGYYDPEEKNENLTQASKEGSEETNEQILEPPRYTRQNPNLSRTKTLVTDDLDQLRIGLTQRGTVKPGYGNVFETMAPDPAQSIYGMAMLATICAAITVIIGGFVFGWYSLAKRAKAAADVDYPVYGVTGPTGDSAGDRKLAHSAHMYHYQHQKQQIIAMERSDMETRDGSVSDPDSEENEEGDYTVYECPGLASTGHMEVNNPMFKEEPGPATPCEGEAPINE